MQSGSSGGGVIDSYYELIGIPSAIVEEESSKIGFISPAALVPEEWMYIINPKPFSF